MSTKNDAKEKMLSKENATSSQDYVVPTYKIHSRTTNLKNEAAQKRRNLWWTFLCFFPTCGYCCGLCLNPDK